MENKEKEFEILLPPVAIDKLMFPLSIMRLINNNSTSPIHDKAVEYILFNRKLMPLILKKLKSVKEGNKLKLNSEDSIYIYTGAVVLTNCYNTKILRDLFDKDEYRICGHYLDIVFNHWEGIEKVINFVLPRMVEFYKDSPAFKARIDLLNKIYNVS